MRHEVYVMLYRDAKAMTYISIRRFRVKIRVWHIGRGNFKWTILDGAPYFSINIIDMDTHTILSITIVLTIENRHFIIRPLQFGSHNLIRGFEAQDKSVLLISLVRRGQKCRRGLNRLPNEKFLNKIMFWKLFFLWQAKTNLDRLSSIRIFIG